MNEGNAGYHNHIIQYPQDYSLCAGCSTCEIVCSLEHDGVVGPRYNRIFLKRGTTTMIHEVLACMQCEDHPCYEQCPKKDEAMRLDENGIVYIVDEYCNGCGRCKKYCKFTPSRINLVKSKDKEKRKAKKCDLCRTRAEGPACIQWCPVCCIGLSNNPQPTLELMGMPPGPPIELRESPMRPAEPLLELESPPSELIGVPGIITRASQTNNDVA